MNLLLILSLSTLFAQTPTIIITEVLANAIAYPQEFSEEFIELFNSTTYPINLSGWQIKTGRYEKTKTYSARICSWDYHGLKNPYNVVTGTTVIKPRQYAVIISTWYLTTSQRYCFPENTLLLTTTIYFRYEDGSLGYQISLSNDEAISLLDDKLKVISTFGDPNILGFPKSSTFPTDAGSGVSWERINYGDINPYDIDVATNWARCADITGSTPGRRNSIVKEPLLYTTQKLIEVKQSPFFPYGDFPEKPKEAAVVYNVPEGSIVTLKIFDVRGNLVFTPINQDITAGGQKIYYWNGKDEYGNTLPTGCYIAYIEATEQNKGLVHKDKAVVILGRRLK